MTKTLLITGVAAGALLLGGMTAPSYAQTFEGKTIQFIVPAGAGGGLTRNARRFANLYGKFLPGNPKVIVRNVVGGGGQKGINFVYNRGKKDGTMLLWGPLNFAGILTGLRGINYDPSKFSTVGVTGGLPYVTIAAADLGGGLKKADDFVGSPKFNSGGRIPGGALGTFSVLSFNLLGKSFTHITGYRNQPRLKAALMRREIMTATTGAPGYYVFYKDDLLKKGSATALYYHASMLAAPEKMIRSADLDNTGILPFPEYYKKVKGKAPSGEQYDAYKWFATYATWSNWLVAAPGVPEPIMAALRKGYAAAWKDPEVIAQYTKAWGLPGTTLVGDETKAITDNFQKISPEALAYLKTVLGTSDRRIKGKKDKGKRKKK